MKLPKVFYGWWIVCATFFIALYTAGIVFFGFTAVFEPIANEFGWSHAQVSLAASLRGLEMGLLAPITGFLADRRGPRRLVFFGVVITVLGLVLLSQTTSLAMFYGSFALTALGISACTATVMLTAVVNWFQRNVGIATGIATSGFGFGGLLIPLVVGVVDTQGWRTAILIFGLGFLAIGIPLSFLFRDKPERYGYSLDGDAKYPKEKTGDSVQPPASNTEIGTSTAIRSRAFWHIALSSFIAAMYGSAVITHVMPYLSSINIARSVSAVVATAVPLVSILGRLGLGWTSDRFNKRLAASAAYVVAGIGLLCFDYISTTASWPLILFVICFGIGWGGANVVRPALVRESFGRNRFGTIHGVVVGMIMPGTIVGAFIPGWVYDNQGSYNNIWLIGAGITAVASFIIGTTPYTHRNASSTEQPVL
ncbi:MFS transporter [Chloroflexota bacterium]